MNQQTACRRVAPLARRTASLSCLVVLIAALVGCGDGGETRTVTETVTTEVTAEPTAEPVEEPRLQVTSPGRGKVRTDARSIVIRGEADTQGELMLVNVGGPNDSPGGYPEYPIESDSDGRWSQRVKLFSGENAIFVSRGPPGSDLRYLEGDDYVPGEDGYIDSREITVIRSKPAAATEPLTFAGNGGKRIGTIRVPSDATLYWTNDGGLFQIFAEPYGGGLDVNSQAASGDSAVAADTYTDVMVNAVGNWTIRIE